jgi:hypothetical protein
VDASVSYYYLGESKKLDRLRSIAILLVVLPRDDAINAAVAAAVDPIANSGAFAVALKGLEMRTRSGSKVRSRFSPYLVAPSGLTRVGGDSPG